MSTDLFGEQIRTAEPLPPTCDKRRQTKANGYPALPGTGPAGETCRSCEYYARVGGHSKAYRKCLKRGREHWTNGPGTDILARSPACFFWEKAKPDNP